MESNPYINHSGGCPGSDMEWETQSSTYNVRTIAYSFPKHTQYGQNPKVLTESELNEGWEQVKLCEKPLKRPLRNIQYNTYVKYLLCRNWFQVKNSEAIYAIGRFADEEHKLVDGGTGWAVQMAVNNKKPIFFFDQPTISWYEYNYTFGVFQKIFYIPVLTSNFAGIGTRQIDEHGKAAISEILKFNFQ